MFSGFEEIKRSSYLCKDILIELILNGELFELKKIKGPYSCTIINNKLLAENEPQFINE